MACDDENTKRRLQSIATDTRFLLTLIANNKNHWWEHGAAHQCVDRLHATIAEELLASCGSLAFDGNKLGDALNSIRGLTRTIRMYGIVPNEAYFSAQQLVSVVEHFANFRSVAP